MSDVIDRVEVLVTCPGRNFVTLEDRDRDGITGVGDATLNGRELAVAGYLDDHVCPMLIGRDPERIEDIWQYLYRGAYWRRGPVTMAAIAAVDMALWDIKGKCAGTAAVPAARRPGRDGATVYGHANGGTIEATVEAAAATSRRLQGHPRAGGRAGAGHHYGVGEATVFYEPADADLPVPETSGRPGSICARCRSCSRAAREELGWDVHLLHDVHHRLTPIEAARLGKELEPYRLFWLEDRCRPRTRSPSG